jgi:hypothetical protein
MTEPTPAPKRPEIFTWDTMTMAAKGSLEMLKLIPPTAGIMLALIWGLANRSTPPTESVLTAIRVASILLTISIFGSFLGIIHFIAMLSINRDPASFKTVRYFYFLAGIWSTFAWLPFLAGTAFVILGIFLI